MNTECFAQCLAQRRNSLPLSALLLGILVVSTPPSHHLPWESFVFTQCLQYLFCTGVFPPTWEDRGCSCCSPFCPAGLPFRLSLDCLGVAVSTCTAGSTAETQRDGFKDAWCLLSQKGTFRVPMASAGTQVSGKEGGSNQGTGHRTQCIFSPTSWPLLLLYSLEGPPCFFSTYSSPTLFRGLQLVLPAPPLLVQL